MSDSTKTAKGGERVESSSEGKNALSMPSDGNLTEQQQQELIEKLEKESATRKLGSPIVAKAFYILAILVSSYHLYTAAFGPPLTLIHRSLHVGMMLLMAFIMYPFGQKSSYKQVAWYDWLLVILSCAAPLYMWINFEGVVERAGDASMMDMLMATILVLLVLEATRRSCGLAMTVLSIVFIAYGLWGRELPGMFAHRGYTWTALSNHFFANTEGIYGTSVDVASSYIFLFILFGSVMNKSGMGQLFNDIALSLAGASKGGPAKVSVIASGLLGSINGSAIANVVTTGAFTIPLMKKTGYSKDFAGAVEASASVGGQLMPPIMGAAAFIMAEMLGVKYSEIVIWAAVPALLYYLGIMVQVHLRAEKLGLKGTAAEDLPKVSSVIKERGHLLLPIAFLLYMLFFSGTTVIYSAFFTIVVTIIIACVRPATRMSVKDILDAFAEAARSTVAVAVACACVGIIVGVSAKTGFGLNMANAIITLGGMNLMITLIFTMITCMILGMGLPSIPAYIITATIAAPALAKLGIPAQAAHMFSFYFAMFANLTPPVALAAFAAAGLSGGDPFKTGFAACKLAIAGFIVPYMFVYTPELMLIGTTFFQGLRVAAGASIGVVMIGFAVEGYCLTHINAGLRVLTFIGALLLIDPGPITDAVGIGILALLIAVQYFKRKRLASVTIQQ